MKYLGISPFSMLSYDGNCISSQSLQVISGLDISGSFIVRIKELVKDELQLQANPIPCAWAESGACWKSWCIGGAAITLLSNQRAVWVTLIVRRHDLTAA